MTLKALKQTVTGLLPDLRTGRWGLFCDIDGTIAYITPRPEQARVRPGAKRALEALGAQLAAVAVVTGREMKEALCMVGAENIVYFATHGLERWEDGELKVVPEAEPYRDRLRSATAELTEASDVSRNSHADQARGPVDTLPHSKRPRIDAGRDPGSRGIHRRRRLDACPRRSHGGGAPSCQLP